MVQGVIRPCQQNHSTKESKMKIILNRDDIEEAIAEYVKGKYIPYGEDREINIVQGSKATATITLVQENRLPGMDEDDVVEAEAEAEAVAADDADKTEVAKPTPIAPLSGTGFPNA